MQIYAFQPTLSNLAFRKKVRRAILQGAENDGQVREKRGKLGINDRV
jgi:hypothetical protein